MRKMTKLQVLNEQLEKLRAEREQMNKRVREEFLNYQKEYGTPSVFIANKVGFNKVTVSKWLHGEFNFSIPSCELISEYLNRHSHLVDLNELNK